MTDIVDRANKALEGVTEGPWYTLVDEVASQVQGFPILDSEKYEIVGTEGFYGDYDTDWINARFIAEARELVPELVAEIERLREEVKRARVEGMRVGYLLGFNASTFGYNSESTPEAETLDWWLEEREAAIRNIRDKESGDE